MTSEPSLDQPDALADALSRLASATPALIERRQLLRRSDTKFLTTPSALAAIVDRIADRYAVVRVGSGAIASYANLYFDTRDLRSFHDHRRGRRIRHKIRIRTYADRELAFLEIKTRRNELFTDKARMRVGYGTNTLDAKMIAFLVPRCPYAEAVVPTIEIDYRRIMLIGVDTNERVTIDLGVSVDHDDGLALGAVAIIEVKQPSRSMLTPIMQVLREAGVKACSLSKYVTALDPAANRGSRLRPALRHLERMAI